MNKPFSWALGIAASAAIALSASGALRPATPNLLTPAGPFCTQVAQTMASTAALRDAGYPLEQLERETHAGFWPHLDLAAHMIELSRRVYHGSYADLAPYQVYERSHLLCEMSMGLSA